MSKGTLEEFSMKKVYPSGVGTALLEPNSQSKNAPRSRAKQNGTHSASPVSSVQITTTPEVEAFVAEREGLSDAVKPKNLNRSIFH